MNRFDVAAEQARDAMILTNIVRASHSEPLSFVQLGKVSGANTSTATVGLPSLLLGPLSPVVATANLQKDVLFGASAGGGNGYVGNSASTSGSTNFDVSPNETKDFYRGLLTEVEPRTLEFFQEQGMSRELLFYLFTASIVEQRNGHVVETRNDPLSPAFPAFQRSVALAMEYGLSSEPVSSPHAKPAKTKGANDKQTKSSADDDAQQPWQLCFRRTLVKSTLNSGSLSPICGSGQKSPDPRSVSFRGGHAEIVKLTVVPRSTFAIFQYLGRILVAGEAGRVRLMSAEAIDSPPVQDEFLFTVVEGGLNSCFLSIDYEGQSYCVPLRGAANTKRILSMLTQLIALNTSVDEVPVTPTFRVIQ
ncbi:MAG: hypothetical protein P4L76_08445 [Beijerinckiaceae bacterium]|nr:hypothetical protein [Beijerinckiaceae bacterium]